MTKKLISLLAVIILFGCSHNNFKRKLASTDGDEYRLAYKDNNGKAFEDRLVNEAYGDGVRIVCHLMMRAYECKLAMTQAREQALDFSSMGLNVTLVLLGAEDFAPTDPYVLQYGKESSIGIYYKDKNISEELKKLFVRATPKDLYITGSLIELLDEIKGHFSCNDSILKCKNKSLSELSSIK